MATCQLLTANTETTDTWSYLLQTTALKSEISNDNHRVIPTPCILKSIETLVKKHTDETIIFKQARTGINPVIANLIY